MYGFDKMKNSLPEDEEYNNSSSNNNKSKNSQSQNSRAPQESSYVAQGNASQPGYGNTQSQGYGNSQSQEYGSSKPSGYNNTQSQGYGNSQPQGYGNAKPSNQNTTGSQGYGNTQPQEYGSAKPSGYGSTQSQEYGSAKPSGFGNNQSQQYGGAKPPAYGGNKAEESSGLLNKPNAPGAGAKSQQFGSNTGAGQNSASNQKDSSYNDGSSSQQSNQLLACAKDNRDDTCSWMIVPVNGDNTPSGDPLVYGTQVRLFNTRNKTYLHSHPNFTSPKSGQGEVTVFGSDEYSDNNDHWIAERYSDGAHTQPWSADGSVMFKHTNTGSYLHSHDVRLDNGQQEVTCYNNCQDDNNRWVMEY
ncbi:Stromal cell-derived factor 2-like protein [Smittium mucronatum]|uniref:Stromal cell-derived factor 2-like protein n=1 Tax=Smittium mucronatum TaxID=133383 RepID=A0A1R0GTC5_9FUNG|nr:Stromal cell-derived factor 2-like protein [Smittium mucronatum]